MSKRITISLLAVVATAVTVAFTSGVASGSSSAAASGKAQVRVVKIVMRDPGCHWFSVAGKDKARLVVTGKTAFQNLDEATVVFTGKNFTRRVAVGKTLAVATPGTYRITMVGQHADDNHLLLVVK